MTTAVTCSELGAKLMPISCPQTLGKQDFLRNAMNWTSFCPFFVGRVFFCQIKQRRPGSFRENELIIRAGKLQKTNLKSQTYLARFTRFLTPCPWDVSQPGTQESLGTIPQHVCPVILVIASIRNPGDDNGKHCVSGALHRSQIVSWLLQNGSVASFFLGG